MGLKFRIDVTAQPEDVFAYVADFSRHGEWGNPASQLRVEKASDGPIAVGSRFRSTQKFAGRPAQAVLTVRELEAPRKIVFSADQGHGEKKQTFVHTFTFSRSGVGTLVERDLGRENASPLAALGIVFYPAIRSDAMKGLRGLKAKLESGTR